MGPKTAKSADSWAAAVSSARVWQETPIRKPGGAMRRMDIGERLLAGRWTPWARAARAMSARVLTSSLLWPQTASASRVRLYRARAERDLARIWIIETPDEAALAATAAESVMQ